MSKPTIVIVPGAWLSPPFYEPFRDALGSAGYPALIAPLPSLDPPDTSTSDCRGDEVAIRAVVQSLVEDGKDVVLSLHSYAGMPGSGAAKGLSKTERVAQGKKGGVLGLTIVAGFLVPEGVSCEGSQGGELASWILQDTPSPGLNVTEDPIYKFAVDVDDSATKQMVQLLKPHCTLAFKTPQPPPAWADPNFKGRLSFIVPTEDNAVVKEAQYGMMAGTGQEWIVKEMVASHCAPYINRIDEHLKLQGEIIEQFQRV